MFAGLLNQDPWQVGALGDVTPFLEKVCNKNYLWSLSCCNNAINNDNVSRFIKKYLFLATKNFKSKSGIGYKTFR